MQDPKVADTTPTTTPSVTTTTTTASTTIATTIGNTDCVEQQSVCTAACERAGSRQYQVLRNQTKLGRACIGPSDCQPGEDACSTTASTSTAITRTGTSTSATTPTATTTTVARPRARPFDCNAHPSPIQILGVGRNANSNVDRFEVLELDVAKGTYTRLYALETSLIPDDRWTQMNSAGINPIDGIAYASVLVDEIPFLVRFSRDELDFVAKLPVDSFSGTFDSKGNYYIDYFERKPTNMYMLWKIESVDTFRGTKVYNSTSLADLSDMPATAQTNLTNEFTLDDGKVARILQPADLAPIMADFETPGMFVEYLVGVSLYFPDSEGPYKADKYAGLWVFVSNPHSKKFWVFTVSNAHLPAQFNSVATPQKVHFGAAWTYERRMLFASNGGNGIFEVEINNLTNLAEKRASVYYVGPSFDGLTNNDGMNCLAARIPYASCASKDDPATGTPVTDGDCDEGYVYNGGSRLCASTECSIANGGLDHDTCCTKSATETTTSTPSTSTARTASITTSSTPATSTSSTSTLSTASRTASSTTATVIDEIQSCGVQLMAKTGGQCLNGGRCKLKRSNCSDVLMEYDDPVCDCGHTAGSSVCFWGQFCENKVDNCVGGTTACNLVKKVKSGTDPASTVCSTDAWPQRLCTEDSPFGRDGSKVFAEGASVIDVVSNDDGVGSDDGAGGTVGWVFGGIVVFAALGVLFVKRRNLCGKAGGDEAGYLVFNEESVKANHLVSGNRTSYTNPLYSTGLPAAEPKRLPSVVISADYETATAGGATGDIAYNFAGAEQSMDRPPATHSPTFDFGLSAANNTTFSSDSDSDSDDSTASSTSIQPATEPIVSEAEREREAGAEREREALRRFQLERKAAAAAALYFDNSDNDSDLSL